VYTDGHLEFESTDWHRLSSLEIQKRLGVDAQSGLSSSDVEKRTRESGRNRISPIPNPIFWTIFGYFFKGFGGILFVGGILVLISWKPLGNPPAVANLALGIVLFATFLLQAAFSAWQDWSSSRVMKTINSMLPESCVIIRNGVRTQIEASDIVPGDIIILKAGNRIPADLRFLETSHDTTIDRAVLTGIFHPVIKQTSGMSNLTPSF
jgi:magnesium-transporting ATPase (P-type)